MPENIKVLVVNGDSIIRKQISDIISSISDISVVGETESSAKAMQLIEELEPDVSIVGEQTKDNDGFEYSEKVIEKYPVHPIILVSSSGGEEVFRRAMRSGIKEVLQIPLSPISLSDAIYHVHDLKEKHRKVLSQTDTKKGLDLQEKMAKIISVFSTKGGVGKTTVAANLAVVLKETGKKVALLDLDVHSGDIALAMDIVPKRNINDIVNDINRLDLELLESYMFKHSSGLMILPAPMQPEYGDFVSAEHIKKILKTLLWEYDYIVVDCASYMHDPVLVALDASDIIILPTTMDLFAIKNLKSCINALEGLNYSRRKFRLVINRAFRESGITTKDITATLGLPVATVLPEEAQVIVNSVNQGVPAVLSYKKSRFARGMHDLADNVLGKRAVSNK